MSHAYAASNANLPANKTPPTGLPDVWRDVHLRGLSDEDLEEPLLSKKSRELRDLAADNQLVLDMSGIAGKMRTGLTHIIYGVILAVAREHQERYQKLIVFGCNDELAYQAKTCEKLKPILTIADSKEAVERILEKRDFWVKEPFH